MSGRGALVELQSILDFFEDEIEKSSDNEILEIYAEAGLDPVKGPERLKSIINDALLDAKRCVLKQARVNYDSENLKPFVSCLPKNNEERRKLAAALIAKRSQANGPLTLRFRDGDINKISEEELTLILEDLEALGGLTEE